MQVAGLSDPEMYATSQAYGLGQASPLDAMALSQIMAMPSYGYAGPTTGDPSASPLTPGAAMDMFNSQYGMLPQGYGQPSVQNFGPAPGPLANDPYQPNVPHSAGGPGGGPNNGGPGSPNYEPPGTGGQGGGYTPYPHATAAPMVAAKSGAGAPAASPGGGSGLSGSPQYASAPGGAGWNPGGGPITLPPRPTGPPSGGPTPSPGGPPFGGGGNGGSPRDNSPNGAVPMAGGPSGSTWRAVNDASQSGQGVRPTGGTPFWQSPGIQAAQANTGQADQNAINAAYQGVSGQSVRDDPAIAQAFANFNQFAKPQIQNDAALAGLGNSSAMVNSLGQAQAQMALPLYQDAFAREMHTQDLGQGAMQSAIDRMQHTQDRGYGATEEELGRRERSYIRGAEAQQGATDRLMQLSQMQNQRQGQAVNTLAGLGATERGVEQQGNESGYNDMLRRQALSEAALYQPFGGMLPSAFGSRQVSTGK